MTIKNKTAYMGALWDWGFLNQCFGNTGIRVSDIDGAVERCGHVLFIEAKPPDKEISGGQNGLFYALAQSGFTVLVLWGETDNPEMARIWEPHKKFSGNKFKVSKNDVQEIVRRWFVWVNQIPSKYELDQTGKWPITLHLRPDHAGEDK